MTTSLPPLAPARAVREGRFATALVCAECHSNAAGSTAMRDRAGRGVAPWELWRSSMMANAARDPLWRAVVSAEVQATPSQKKAIEAKCTRCHAPMASAEAQLNGEPPSAMSLLAGDDARSQLALDGVSCTLCHQIAREGLGTEASFTGHFVLEPDGRLNGPHANPFAQPMVRRSGYTPQQGAHQTESSLCGSCHTLITDALRPDGTATGDRLHEQGPYLEWRNSAFNDEGQPGPKAASCQQCHVPTTDADGSPISTPIARTPEGRDFPIAARSPFGRHLFVGGNTLMLSILRDNPGTLQSPAPREAFEATLAATREQLQQRTARVSLGEIVRDGGRLEIPVRIENLAGHKFPTGYPSRRAWVRMTVRDAGGRVVFDSGAFDAEGRLVAGGAVLPSERAGGPVQPHRDLVSAPEEVAIYETVMAEADGTPTWRLLRGAKYAKDNRILPEGWQAAHADGPATAPAGTSGDPDFAAGGDSVRYRVDAPDAAGPYAIEATLLFQTLSTRFAEELFTVSTSEVEAFRRLLAAADRRPEPIGKATATAR